MKKTKACVSIDEITEYMINKYSGVVFDKNWGERGVFYNPKKRLPKGVYILIFKEKDGKNDSASLLGDGDYRLNLGLTKQSFVGLFESVPKRPSAGAVIDTGHDFSKRNTILPHPVYGWMGWIAIINPTHESFENLKLLIDESYSRAARKFNRKVAK